MEESPRGYRRHEDEHLFTRPTTDECIVPDRVSPAVEGYFRLPAVWIGGAPSAASVRVLNPPIHHAVVLEKKLGCGIKVRVQRDGTFLFDFSSWPLAPMVQIPGYRFPDPNTPHLVPREHSRKQEDAEAIAVLRAQVMNVHQACLTTSEYYVKHRTTGMGLPLTAWNTHKAISIETLPSYYDDPENIQALARNLLNNIYQVSREDAFFSRRVLEIDVVEHSFDLLDDILAEEDIVLVQIIEAAYMAACRRGDKRFGEAVTLAWGACEQLISLAWLKLLEDIKKSGKSAGRMPKDRREKLSGRDYTVSVKVETLEMNERIDHDLYRVLEIARKARNKWAHEMRVPKESEATICIRAVQTLLKQVKGVQLSLGFGGRGGVPEWPIWLWEQVKAGGGP